MYDVDITIKVRGLDEIRLHAFTTRPASEDTPMRLDFTPDGSTANFSVMTPMVKKRGLRGCS